MVYSLSYVVTSWVAVIPPKEQHWLAKLDQTHQRVLSSLTDIREREKGKECGSDNNNKGNSN